VYEWLLLIGDDFRSKASNYLLSALSKGVPSLFADIKALYSDTTKQRMIGEIVESFRETLEKKGAIITDAVSEGKHPSANCFLEIQHSRSLYTFNQMSLSSPLRPIFGLYTSSHLTTPLSQITPSLSKLFLSPNLTHLLSPNCQCYALAS